MTTRLLANTLLAFVLLAGLLLLASVPTASAADPPPEPSPVATPAGGQPGAGGGGPLIVLPDPKVWAAEVFLGVLTGTLGTVIGALRLVVAGVMDGSLNFVTQTPAAATYANGTVQGLWGTVRAIANAALVLVALWAGYNLIAAEQLGSPYHDTLELLPRLILGALLVNTSLTWAQLAIDANNALCQAIGGATLPAWEQAGVVGNALAEILAALVYFVGALLLVLQMLMRLALVDVLLVASPIALLCWVLPQTQQWARLWSTTFVAAVFCQFLQVLALKLGGSLIADGAVIGSGAVLLKLLLGVAVIVLTLRIPALLRVQAGGGLGFVRYYAYRAGANALGGGRGGGGSGKGAGGAAKAAGAAAKGGA